MESKHHLTRSSNDPLDRFSRRSKAAGSRPATAGLARIAILDGDDEAVVELEAALRAAGYAIERVTLSDYESGEAALAAILDRKVDVVLYELGDHLRQNQSRFQELYSATVRRGTPLFITSVRWWRPDEAGGHAPRGHRADRSPAIQRLLQAIAREINVSRRHG